MCYGARDGDGRIRSPGRAGTGQDNHYISRAAKRFSDSDEPEGFFASRFAMTMGGDVGVKNYLDVMERFLRR